VTIAPKEAPIFSSDTSGKTSSSVAEAKSSAGGLSGSKESKENRDNKEKREKESDAWDIPAFLRRRKK
jgi:hypothetical protein